MRLSHHEVTLSAPVNYANYPPGRFIAINQEAFGAFPAPV